jgi:hypothetical protein
VESVGLGLNPRQRKFAELAATGIPAGRAYEQAGYNAKSALVADSAAARLSANVKVAAYVREIRAAAAEQGKDDAILTIREKREYLARVVRTPIGDVTTDSDLCQEHARTDGPESSFEKFKMPGKLEAIKLDSLLAGELADPNKHGDVNVSVNVTVSAEKLREIQDRRKAALAVHGRN